ncbi:protein TPR1-like [Impatiens glandulifera]|uniref:protein TPR1-like n=1 Tax=Impatiens glandulifera TaxID=253017 RepID=UPI001FB0A036|nr:protein TPR1-like [Impatiens glandulifera]
MAELRKDILYLIMQFLGEQKYNETLHILEAEAKLLFDMEYFLELIVKGTWEEADKYFSSFTNIDEHPISMKVLFEIRKHKYLEALDRHDIKKAIELLMHELKEFGKYNDDLYTELTGLLTKNNFREHRQLYTYTTPDEARVVLAADFKKLLVSHPVLNESLRPPPMEGGRLRTLINQSLNWQHQMCKTDQPNPDILTLYEDHHCSSSVATNNNVQPDTGARGQNQ